MMRGNGIQAFAFTHHAGIGFALHDFSVGSGQPLANRQSTWSTCMMRGNAIQALPFCVRGFIRGAGFAFTQRGSAVLGFAFRAF